MVNVIKSNTGNGDCHRRQRKELADGCTAASGNQGTVTGWRRTELSKEAKRHDIQGSAQESTPTL